MLDPWIIEEIIRRESERRHEEERPHAELPIERGPVPPVRDEAQADEDQQRGVVVIDI